jgi:hypothetical protein
MWTKRGFKIYLYSIIRMNYLVEKFKTLFSTESKTFPFTSVDPIYPYYAEIDMDQWTAEGKPPIKDFLKNNGAYRIYGPNQERPDNCVGVEKGWIVTMRK